MEHIDKSNNLYKVKADSVVNDFIAHQRLLGNEPKYFIFCKTSFKNKLRDILIEEQDYYCCYCMRILKKDDSTTIEHIIPKGVDLNELNSYKICYPNYFTEVIHRDCFNSSSITPPYPHQIAYQNLSASCKGILQECSDSPHCCNNKRLRAVINPLFFDGNIANIVEYIALTGESKSCNVADATIASTINNLGLNNDTLKEIRFLWALITKKGLVINVTINRNHLLNDLFGTELLSNLPIHFVKYGKYFTQNNMYYWDLLMSYRWFEGYFRKKWSEVAN